MFATWSSWNSARIVCLKTGTRPMLIRCLWSLQMRLTHVVAALSMTDQQEADKLLGDPLSCHVCTVTVPDSHYLTVWP